MHPLFAFIEGAFAPSHILLVLVIGIFLFGRRLPEMGRSLGKGLVEFKRAMNGVEESIGDVVHGHESSPALERPRPPQRVATPAPSFQDTTANPGNPTSV